MQVPTRNIWWWWLRKFPKVIAEIFFVWEGYLGDTSEKPSIKEHHSQIWRIFVEPKVELGKCIWKSDNYTLYVPSSKHGIWAMAMVIHPILGIITMGILNPIDGCMTIPLYEKTNHVLTTAHININKMISKKNISRSFPERHFPHRRVPYFVPSSRDTSRGAHLPSRLQLLFAGIEASVWLQWQRWIKMRHRKKYESVRYISYYSFIFSHSTY